MNGLHYLIPLFICLSLLSTHQAAVLGGYTPLTNLSDYDLLNVSDYIISQHLELTNEYQLTEASTQLVNGKNYKITYTDTKAENAIDVQVYAPFVGTPIIKSYLKRSIASTGSAAQNATNQSQNAVNQSQNIVNPNEIIVGGFSIEQNYTNDALFIAANNQIIQEYPQLGNFQISQVLSQLVNGKNFIISYLSGESTLYKVEVYVDLQKNVEITNFPNNSTLQSAFPVIVGGYSAVDLNNTDSIYELAKQTVLTTHPELSNYSIKAAAYQVVAGRNYRIVYERMSSEGVSEAVATVYVDLSNNASLTDYLSQLLVLNQTTALALDSSLPVIVGGYFSIDVNSSDPIYQLALKQVYLKHPELSHASISSASQQIVAGSNFNLLFITAQTNVQLTVYVDLNQNASITGYQVNINKPLTGGFSAIDSQSNDVLYLAALKQLIEVHPQLQLYSIQSVLEQIVNGKNFMFKLVKDAVTVEAKVYVSLAKVASITSYNVNTNQLSSTKVGSVGKTTSNMSLSEMGVALAIANSKDVDLSSYVLVDSKRLSSNGDGLILTFKKAAAVMIVYVYFPSNGKPQCFYYRS